LKLTRLSIRGKAGGSKVKLEPSAVAGSLEKEFTAENAERILVQR
jgi:hypothetical protein